MSTNNKVFLSIGSGPGMGAATAERFAREGYTVVLTARDAARLELLAGRLKKTGARVETRTVDAGDAEAITALVREVERAQGSVDVLHFNAASMRKAKLSEQPLGTLNTDLAINIGGALAAIKAVEVGMQKRGQGSVLLTGGGFAMHPSPDYLLLSIGKAGIRALAQGLFDEYREKGIHVATVTVGGFTGDGDAERVADEFWKLHAQEPSAWTNEVMFTPRG